jgi:predicted DNA-binding protein (UPF0251 family)/predicted Fe-Mo cluster-binding NifX family protein
MVRARKYRTVSSMPCVTYFKPAGIPMRELAEIMLSVEEAEALRLKEIKGLDQLESAERMGISRPTFQRVLKAARKKTATALLTGKALRIEGGSFRVTIKSLKKSVEGEGMKFAVPVYNGRLSPHFGQSTQFMIIDTDQGRTVTGKEIVSTEAHSCGRLPRMLAELGVNVVLAGGMGYSPRLAFQRSGIEVVLGVIETDPEKAVMAFLDDMLISGQNACEHGDIPCDHGH